ncbi:unnamed protein product [Soboliphyme baturini]|uniref:PEHE domain-containing protein n=1 Tax=Soboliphyme baturini TaxID=241478 RepID=A0A183IED1_9BILA|nr:unnamed protein product [Soboliphyme baturini]
MATEGLSCRQVISRVEPSAEVEKRESSAASTSTTAEERLRETIISQARILAQYKSGFAEKDRMIQWLQADNFRLPLARSPDCGRTSDFAGRPKGHGRGLKKLTNAKLSPFDRAKRQLAVIRVLNRLNLLRACLKNTFAKLCALVRSLERKIIQRTESTSTNGTGSTSSASEKTSDCDVSRSTLPRKGSTHRKETSSRKKRLARENLLSNGCPKKQRLPAKESSPKTPSSEQVVVIVENGSENERVKNAEILTPGWRICPQKPLWSIDGTEDITDNAYKLLHHKYELEERRIIKRDQLRQKALMRQKKEEERNKPPSKSVASVPAIRDIKYIEIVPSLPSNMRYVVQNPVQFGDKS